MAHLLHDVYDWYKDLMDNRSGEAHGNLSSRKVFLIYLFSYSQTLELKTGLWCNHRCLL